VQALPAADERRACPAACQQLPACLPASLPACLPAGLPACLPGPHPSSGARRPRAAGEREGGPSGTRIALRATNPLLVSPSIISFNIVDHKARPSVALRTTNHPLFRRQAPADGRPALADNTEPTPRLTSMRRPARQLLRRHARRALPSSRRPAPRLSPTGGPPMRPSPTGVRPYPHSTESTARSTSLCKTARDTPRLREIPRAPLSPTRDDWPSPVTCRPTVGRHSRV